MFWNFSFTVKSNERRLNLRSNYSDFLLISCLVACFSDLNNETKKKNEIIQRNSHINRSNGRIGLVDIVQNQTIQHLIMEIKRKPEIWKKKKTFSFDGALNTKRELC